MNNIYKKAFTLAEVLITLAIIGVITAMTLPALINKTNNAEIVTGVKKYQSLLNQAITKYEADNGCIGNLSACNAFSGASDHETAWNAIKPYFNITKDCGISIGQGCFPKDVVYKWLNGTNKLVIDNQEDAKALLADGSCLLLWDATGNCDYPSSRSGKDPMAHLCGDFWIDINGFKGPNQIGRDTFSWRITNIGVYPTGHYDDYTADSNGNAACDPSNSNLSTAPYPGAGIGCTAKVIKEGAINY